MQESKIKTTTAKVVSKSGNKTVKVSIDYKVKHPKYGKYIRKRITLSVHDENNLAGVGDVIDMVECRPYSKSKSWRLIGVSTKAAPE